MDNINPLEANRRHMGLTVPEGYFDDFAARMAASLPEQPWERDAIPAKRTPWQVVRPYVYMAAMFLGVWCMMKVFDHARPSNVDLNIDSNPVLTAAVSNDRFMEEYFYDDLDDNDIMVLNASGV